MTEDTQAELDVFPGQSPRAERELRIETSWLERIDTYQAQTNSSKNAATSIRRRIVVGVEPNE